MTTPTPQLSYIETSIPAGITIHDYRVSRPPRAPFWRRALAQLHGTKEAGACNA